MREPGRRGSTSRGVRFTTAVTSAIGLITGSWRVLAAQAVLFAACAFPGRKLNPRGRIYRSTAQHLLGEPAERESPERGTRRSRTCNEKEPLDEP